MTFRRRRIAVIGAGVAGLGAAWALRDSADVFLFEKEDRVGGHACTVDVDYDGEQTPVDIGFICFNRPNYPNLTALFAHLGVRTVATDMSFAVSDPDGYEWGSDPLGLFAWKRNLFDTRFRALIGEILRFNSIARDAVARNAIPDMTLGDWLDGQDFSQLFRDAYLMPMSAAIWSTPEKLMPDYPVASFLTFFDNHRLMHALRPIWRTVAGGSCTYVQRLMRDLGPNVRPAVRHVRPAPAGAIVTDASGQPHHVDAVIFACHADQARALLDPAYEDQRLALVSIRFSSNDAWLHRDTSLMPARRAAWASWNVLRGADDDVCVSYWMNRLQAIPRRKPLFVTLNPVREPAGKDVFGVWQFEHPMYDAASAAARRAVHRLQGRDGLYFAGAWLGDGFHEAGLRTGLEAAFALGGETPWSATVRNTLPAPDFTQDHRSRERAAAFA